MPRHPRIMLVALLLVAAFSGVAYAEPETTEKDLDLTSASSVAVQEYNPDVAQALSSLSTLLPLAVGGAMGCLAATTFQDDPIPLTITGVSLGSLGLILGPSVGHLYSGNYGQGFLNAGIRLTLGAAGFVSLMGCFATGMASSDGPEPPNHYPWAIPTLIVSTLGFAGSIIFDLVTARRSARKANEAARKRKAVSVTPSVFTVSEGSGGGLALVGTF